MLALSRLIVLLNHLIALSSNKNSHNNLIMTPRRGAFIVLEGIDRCGKTTQTALLHQRLTEYLASTSTMIVPSKATKPSPSDPSPPSAPPPPPPPPLALRFPDRNTAVGQLINQYLQSTSDLDDHAIHLLFSANRWEVADRMVDALLNQGQSIVCDRYAYSGVAFSAAKVVREDVTGDETETPLLSMEWCQAPDKGLPAPDCVIFLDLPQEEAERRGGFGGERYEKRDMQRRVRQRFAELQAADEGRVPWNVVSATQSVEDVHADIWSIVLKTLETVQQQGKPLGKMWQDEVFEAHFALEADKENQK